MERSIIDWRAACVIALLMAGCSQKAQVAAAELPDQGSPGAALVTGYCTECHGAPSPSSHSAKEWAGVVERMQNWRVTKGFGAIPDRDLGPLLDYLKSHGRTE
ncbi:MAG: hypothetical protein ACYCY8_09945 [Burkholderiales bacterium]